MKSGRSLVDLATELERQLASKLDLLVPTRHLVHRTEPQGDCRLAITEPGAHNHYAVTELARRQLADKLKIPFQYFERMRAEQPTLLDSNVNTWLGSGEDERLMVRMLDGRVRAILSDRYRRLDHVDLAEHILPILQRLPDARFESVELTETRMYLKVVTPRVEAELAPGDIAQAGVVVTNSEVGCGTLSVQPLLFRLICKNGLIAPDTALRKTHLGRAVSVDDSGVIYKDDTVEAEDKALFLKVRDVVEAAVSEATFKLIADKFRRTKAIKLIGDPVKSIEVLAQRWPLSNEERRGVLRSLIETGDLTGFGLVNAVTHYSQDVENYDRATELEALGGRLVELPAKDWKEVAEAV